MSIKLYDDAVSKKIQEQVRDSNVRVLKPDESTRFFQMSMDQKFDKPLTLPLIALSRDKNIDLLEVTKQQKTYNGFVFQQTENQTLTVNVIPIKLTYQLDIYTRKMEEADEYLRNFIFNLINYPNIDITIPYNNLNYTHRSGIKLEPTLSDNSDIKEHLIPDEFTRFSLRFSIEDAYLFSAPITYNTIIDSVQLDVKDRTLNEIVQSEVINLTEN